MGVKNISQLVKIVGKTQQVVSAKKAQGKEFPIEWAYLVAKKYNLSTDWVLTGEGDKHVEGNTIIIDKDYNYLDENGFKIGSSIKKIRGKLGNGSKNTISDKKNGIIYWHNGKKVTKIVLVKSLAI